VVKEPNNIIKLISPSENLKSSVSSKYLYETFELPDSISDVEAWVVVNNLKIVADNKGFCIYDNNTKKIRKHYKFKFDSIMMKLLSVNLNINKNKSKILVTTSSGQSTTALIFQIDLNSLRLDWLNEFAYQITSACYTNDASEIAIGTGYFKKKSKKDHPEYYSSLFIINSKNGKFIKYYNQGESVARIKFSDDHQLLYSVLGWPHVDTYVWNIYNKKDKIGAFGKNQTMFYDACYIDKNSFVSIGDEGIYKWNISSPEDYKIIHSQYINGTDKLFRQDDNLFILVNYVGGSSNPPEIKYFDQQFKLTDSIKLTSTFVNIILSDTKLFGVTNNSIIYFDIKNKTVQKE